MLYLGVDGGNTKTIAIISRANGEIIGYGRRGCSDIYAYPDPQMAIEQLAGAVDEALAMAGASPQELQVSVFCLAGADYPEDFALFESAMRDRQFGSKISVYNDAIGALRAGSPDGMGVSVVCGTGGAIGARARDGRLWHSSFWQDVGGAHHLGAKTMAALARAELGITVPTSLTERVLTFFGEQDFEAILHRHTWRDKENRLPVAQIAPILLEEAERGDAIAVQLVTAHGIRFGEYAAAAARKLDLHDYYLVLAGSVFKSGSKVFENAILEPIRATARGFTLVNSRYEPAIGALLLALEAGGHMVSGKMLSLMDRTMPPHGLFATGAS